MPPDLPQLVVAVLGAWGLAVIVKSAAALRAGRGYTFAQWDGGALRAGHALTRRGTQIKLVLGAIAALLGTGWLAGLLPVTVAFYATLANLVASVISSYVNAERS
ncbi:MAG: hypothetical protein E6J90_33385 [Deltaproteobacteria bacterium]|nr:MAG: hypothetical protein E6J90_33385 [Deltaproteobacteria bacterium]TMQ14196.1 MAG: hypothetical protein E6J91_16035 [Deltaproteobacteria bacterium]